MDEFASAYEKARRIVLDAIHKNSNELALTEEEFFDFLLEIPPEIARLRHLEAIHISSRSGLDSHVLNGLSEVRRVSLYGAGLKATITWPFPNVEDLTLATKYSWLPSAASLQKLRKLVLNYTLDTVSIEQLAELPALGVIEVNNFVWEQHDPLGQPVLPSLYSLTAEITNLTAATLARMPTLETLRLGGSSITEAALEHLSQLPRLKVLELDRTKVSDLRPVLDFVSVSEDEDILDELTYSGTPATEHDRVLDTLSQITDRRSSTRLTLEYLREREELQSRIGANIEAAQQEASASLVRLQDNILIANEHGHRNPEALAPIGHNKPPPDEVAAHPTPTVDEMDALLREIRNLKSDVDGLATQTGRAEAKELEATFSRFLVVGKPVLAWVARKADKALEVAIAVEATQFVLGKSGFSDLAAAFTKALAAVEHLIQSLVSLQ
jgi:hypothetical protein